MSSSNCKTCAVVELLQSTLGDYEAWARLVECGNTRPSYGWREGLPEVVVYDLDPIQGDGYYGEGCHPQGHEGVCFLVFKVQDEFWKISGTTDSYANRQWGVLPVKVQAKTKEVIVYELED